MWKFREATPADAEALIEYVHALVDVPLAENNITLEPGEFEFTVEQEREYVREVATKPNSVMMVAEPAGAVAREIIATAEWRGGVRNCSRHVAGLGISVLPAWRGKGLGRAMLQAMLAWARTNRHLQRLELSVFTRNEVAVRLYEAVGFKHEGRKVNAMYRGGEYLDEFIMGMWLEKDDQPKHV